MNTYEITYWDNTITAVGATAGKAKYQAFIDRELGDFMNFGLFVQITKCRLLHKFKVSDLFTENLEMFEYMKEQRGIPFATLGMKVEVDGKPGVIIGYCGLNLEVCFDGTVHGVNCHPWWRVKYFDSEGIVIKEYGD